MWGCHPLSGTFSLEASHLRIPLKVFHYFPLEALESAYFNAVSDSGLYHNHLQSLTVTQWDQVVTPLFCGNRIVSLYLCVCLLSIDSQVLSYLWSWWYTTIDDIVWRDLLADMTRPISRIVTSCCPTWLTQKSVKSHWSMLHISSSHGVVLPHSTCLINSMREAYMFAVFHYPFQEMKCLCRRRRAKNSQLLPPLHSSKGNPKVFVSGIKTHFIIVRYLAVCETHR